MEQLGITLKRIIRSGFHYFWRNGFVSLSSILVMVITLSMLAGILFGNAVLTSTLNNVRSQVDINVYFTTEANEQSVLAVQEKLENLSEVDSVTYVSRQEALEQFRERNQGDQTLLQAPEELDENPLRPRLNVQATDPSHYQRIDEFLRGESTALSAEQSSLIDNVNYRQNQQVIAKLNNILDTSRQLALSLMVVMIALSVIITFNTIRLAIYISREEIAVMRLVGASKFYIRGPFVVSGMLYGFVSGIITLAIFLPITYWLATFTTDFFGGFDIFTYYLTNFGYVFLWVVVGGILIGAISSYLAVKRYLKV